jgi:CheY-like chemotaxis protein
MARILVVDDETDLRSILRRFLERAGHEVVEAGHGVEALAAAAEGSTDVVVTDMMMPVMNGAELIRELRAESTTAAIPIIVVSGDGHLAACADAIIDKPVLADDVLFIVNLLLSRSDGSETRFS